MKSIEELGISPLPWEAVRWGGSDERMFYSVYDSSGGAVCDCLRSSNRIESDARIMAAAPELYEALRLACGSCIDCDKVCSDCINFNRSWMPKARAALAKAGGAE